jgi:hypothetical protein
LNAERAQFLQMNQLCVARCSPWFPSQVGT